VLIPECRRLRHNQRSDSSGANLRRLVSKTHAILWRFRKSERCKEFHVDQSFEQWIRIIGKIAISLETSVSGRRGGTVSMRNSKFDPH